MRSARLFYETSERARRIIESYFVLNSTLHFSYTHLVCRTAIKGLQLTPKPVFSKGNKMLPFTPMNSNIQEEGWLLRLRHMKSSVVIFPLGQQDHRNDLSHPIHADNCLLDPDANECWKEPPAYTNRDYRYELYPDWSVCEVCFILRRSCFNILLCFSALLYLNGDFEGGEFIFTEMDAKTVTVRSLSSKDDFIAFICFVYTFTCKFVLNILEQ